MVSHFSVWLALLFWDMKYARMMTKGWFTIAAYAVGSTLVFGPGAMIGLGWLWREDVITHKRHWAAVTDVSGGAERRDSGVGPGGKIGNGGVKKV